MSALTRLVVFRLDERRYALPLGAVERIVHSVEVTPLPGAPSIVLGAIDLEGRLLPVLDIRRRFGLPERQIALTDHFLVARTPLRAVVLVIDEALDVIQRPQSEIVCPAEIAPGLEQLQGIVKLDDGLVLIQDLEKFLSLDEARALDEAMNQRAT